MARRPARPFAAPRHLAILCLLALTNLALGMTCSSGPGTHEPQGRQTFASPQSNPIALSPDGTRLYVANTTSDSVDVIDTASQTVIKEIHVGIEPVGLAVRPDGLEVWVANHVSDSVSVIDTDPASDTHHQVVATVQDVDGSGVTQFDEPVAIAFASNSKAYVSLSSRNDIAVVDVPTRNVTKQVHITAQDPRALTVRNGLLYVAAFESSNQTELSICPDGGSAPQCTLDIDDLADFLTVSPNIPGSDTRIVVDPDVPDRDLFVFETGNENLVEAVEHVGTLLYGLVVDSNGQAFISQVHARNEVNGEDGENLNELENRLFLNQIARVTCTGGGCGSPSLWELEPLPPSQPAIGDALATPYGIALSDDDSTLVVTAMGTSRLFTVDASNGSILDILDLNDGVPADFGQQIPKGVALRSDVSGAPETAYVLNTLENTVSVVDVSTPSSLSHVLKIPVGDDPTPDAERRGRIAFNNAFASTTGTFSCESCHPDGNTDQLLWRIGGACSTAGCTGDDEIRSTMPVRGLKNTLPLHWDGVLGDPFGGGNGDVGVGGNGGTDCTLGDADGDLDCFRSLVDASLSGVMCIQSPPGPGCQPGPSGLDGELTNAERDDMALFLGSVAYPPPRARPVDDVITQSASDGFADFFLDQGGLGSLAQVKSCADTKQGCHSLPLGVDTNSVTLGAFDAPTMRGMTDRFLQFSLGITGAEESMLFANVGGEFEIPGLPDPVPIPPSAVPYDPADGLREDVVFASAFAIFEPVYGAGPLDMLQMFEEASTGFSGALGRQVTVSDVTTTGGNLTATEAILDNLEQADERGVVNLVANGARRVGGVLKGLYLTYRSEHDEYRDGHENVKLTRAQLLSEAAAGDLIVTATAKLGANVGTGALGQPLIFPPCDNAAGTGRPALPVLPGDNPMTLGDIDVELGATILVNGVPASGSITSVTPPGGPTCHDTAIEIQLTTVPSPNGLHMVQVVNPSGLISNELPICVGSVAGCL